MLDVQEAQDNLLAAKITQAYHANQHCARRCLRSHTVNPVGPVFHLFSLGNPDFIIYMAELRADEFGMNFQL